MGGSGRPGVRARPRRNRAAPTPPASTAIRLATTVPDAPVECGPLHGRAPHGAHERLDLLGRGVFPGVCPRLARDALLHERAAEVVASRAQRELRQAVAELHPGGLEV